MKLTAESECDKSLISIVDDDVSVRESLSGLMRSVGFTAKEYTSAEDFLTWGWWDEAACLIIDVRLPAMSGLELQRYLTESQNERPVVLISGRATENERMWATMRGAVAFLRKPFTDELLLEAVRESIVRGRTMVEFDPGMPRRRICPLCHESAQVAEVPKTLMVDHINFRASAVKMIKTLNPDWMEQDGLCHRCWRFYVGLGRSVDFLRGPNVRPLTSLCDDESSAGGERKFV